MMVWSKRAQVKRDPNRLPRSSNVYSDKDFPAMRLNSEIVKTLTLWLAKLALLNTSLQGLIEEGIEHLVCGIDFVVGLDIFLEGNTAVTEATVSNELITGMRRRQVNKI